MYEKCFGEGPFIFRINDTGSGPHLLTQVCLERGWREYNPDYTETWNLWWRTSGFPVSHHKSLLPCQYINHIPKGSSICRKDNLVRYLRCMKKIYGAIYDFSPSGYNLPLEYTKLAAECNKANVSRDKEGMFDEKPIWICKPVAQSQGRGIFLFTKLSELTYDSNTIVQRYIEKPLLIGGYKFDLRLYVCIPSYHPITVYMYREGLARFGTDKFSLNDLRNPFRHLTNSSINKMGPGYAEMKDGIGSGCKWTLKHLRRYFQQASIKDWLLWQKISSLVILTLLSHVAQVPSTVNCFEFFGFDVLIDSSLRPWLLEVNLSPALGSDCDADRTVKKPMLHDLFDLLGLPLFNTGLEVYNVWLDDTKENGDEINRPIPVAVLNAAGRWRRKHSGRPKSRKNDTNLRPRSKTVALTRQKPNLGELRPNSNREGGHFWGNGRNWKEAPPHEGGWVRIFPLNEYDGRISVKSMVLQMVKFTKAAKEVARKHLGASESQLTEFLKEELDISSDLWIPPV